MVSAARRQIIGGGGAPINKSRRRRRPQIVGGGGARLYLHFNLEKCEIIALGSIIYFNRSSSSSPTYVEIYNSTWLRFVALLHRSYQVKRHSSPRRPSSRPRTLFY